MTFAAVDPDNAAVTYSISGGADASKFAIDPTSGALSFVAAPNYEATTDAGADRIYDVIVRASDGATSDTQALSISVTNVIEPFAITSHGGGDSGALTVNEGAVRTFIVATNEAANLTFSLSGSDAARFTILAGTGGSRTISFAAAPNYEGPDRRRRGQCLRRRRHRLRGRPQRQPGARGQRRQHQRSAGHHLGRRRRHRRPLAGGERRGGDDRRRGRSGECRLDLQHLGRRRCGDVHRRLRHRSARLHRRARLRDSFRFRVQQRLRRRRPGQRRSARRIRRRSP